MVGTLLIGIPAYSMLGCSSSDGSDTQPPPSNNTKDCLANGTQSSIGGNHGHTLQVSVADVQSGGHSHNITVSSANFASLKGNQQIQVTSSTGDSHTHSVTISCA